MSQIPEEWTRQRRAHVRMTVVLRDHGAASDVGRGRDVVPSRLRRVYVSARSLADAAGEAMRRFDTLRVCTVKTVWVTRRRSSRCRR